MSVYWMKFTKQALNDHEQGLCQLTVWFEFQSRSEKKKRTQKLCPANGIQKYQVNC